jgi:molybdenum cofactor sulfurtransferase
LIKSVQENGLKLNNNYHNNKNEWFICLDVASLISTSNFDLNIYKPDFLVVSFYKIFGFPTGIGALIVKKSEKNVRALAGKDYFGGGTIDNADTDSHQFRFRNSNLTKDGTLKLENFNFHEFYEDGTIDYLQIIAISLAIDKWSNMTLNKGFKLISMHVELLTEYCLKSLKSLDHFNKVKLVETYRNDSFEVIHSLFKRKSFSFIQLNFFL